jgi:hypothetical protein
MCEHHQCKHKFRDVYVLEDKFELNRLSSLVPMSFRPSIAPDPNHAII